jgi:hypothetical protein
MGGVDYSTAAICRRIPMGAEDQSLNRNCSSIDLQPPEHFPISRTENTFLIYSAV